MKFLAVILCFLAFAIPAQASESNLSFATLNWEPYAAESLPNFGFASAIVAEASKRAGFNAEFYFIPWTRAMAEVKIGKYDALFNAYDSEQRRIDYGVSLPYYQTQLVLCTTTDTDIEYDGSTQSLHKYRFGVVRGYVNTKAIDNDTELIKDEAENDRMNLNKLVNGRVDVIAIDKYQALYLIKNDPAIQDAPKKIRFLSPVLEMKPIHVMFSKKTPDWAEKLHRFNHALDTVIKDGTINDIMLEYGIAVPQRSE